MFRPVAGLSSGEGSGDTGHIPGEADGYDPEPSETRLKLLGDVSYEGKVITEEEAPAYFTREYRSIKSALEASGVPAENMVISGRGYCHVIWNGGYPVVRQDFRDYPVYSGGWLISIITITKETAGLGIPSPSEETGPHTLNSLKSTPEKNSYISTRILR